MRNTFFSIVLVALFCAPNLSQAQEPFLGEIRMFAGNFAPRGWALCDGQLLSISQHSALFALLGTMYGGDGRTTFALPDLRGRAPIHAGNGPGLTPFSVGQKGGVETIALMAVGVSDESKNKAFIIGNNGGRYGAVNIRDPYITVNYIIALQGTFPSRN